MAKAKSTKLRVLHTLYALHKYTDKKHGLNSFTLNDYLKQYNLDCSGNKYFRSIIKALREFGVDVQRKNGVWIKNRHLTDEILQLINFAVTTNPHVSKEQATDVLNCLKPYVTIYQEEILDNYVEVKTISKNSETLLQNSCIIQKAIINEKQIKFTSCNTSSPCSPRMIFSPKSIYKDDNRLFLSGYNHTKQVEEEVELVTLTNVKLIKK